MTGDERVDLTAVRTGWDLGYWQEAAERRWAATTAMIGSPYEAPEQPELIVDTVRTKAEEAADVILRMLERAKLFTP